MNETLQRWMDGELTDDQLPVELRPEAERLRTLLDAPRPIGPAPSWLEARVMGGLPDARPGILRRWADAVLRPRTLRVRPLTAVGSLVAAGLALALLWPESQPVLTQPQIGPITPVSTSAARTDNGEVFVQFVYVAPEAGSVAVAGDFNEWSEGGFQLRDPDGDGVWTGRLPLSPGLHKYMFVVDGEWVTDPLADRYVDDGFGNRNALIDVTAYGSAT